MARRKLGILRLGGFKGRFLAGNGGLEF